MAAQDDDLKQFIGSVSGAPRQDLMAILAAGTESPILREQRLSSLYRILQNQALQELPRARTEQLTGRLGRVGAAAARASREAEAQRAIDTRRITRRAAQAEVAGQEAKTRAAQFEVRTLPRLLALKEQEALRPDPRILAAQIGAQGRLAAAQAAQETARQATERAQAAAASRAAAQERTAQTRAAVDLAKEFGGRLVEPTGITGALINMLGANPRLRSDPVIRQAFERAGLNIDDVAGVTPLSPVLDRASAVAEALRSRGLVSDPDTIQRVLESPATLRELGIQ